MYKNTKKKIQLRIEHSGLLDEKKTSTPYTLDEICHYQVVLILMLQYRYTIFIQSKLLEVEIKLEVENIWVRIILIKINNLFEVLLK